MRISSSLASVTRNSSFLVGRSAISTGATLVVSLVALSFFAQNYDVVQRNLSALKDRLTESAYSLRQLAGLQSVRKTLSSWCFASDNETKAFPSSTNPPHLGTGEVSEPDTSLSVSPFLKKGMCSAVYNEVLSYLPLNDQTALTSTCRELGRLRSEVTPWKKNLKLLFNVRNEEELVQALQRRANNERFSITPETVELFLTQRNIRDTVLRNLLTQNLTFSARITSLTLDISALSSEGFDSLQHLPNLASLKVTQSSLSSLQALAACSHLSSLRSLDFSYNRIGAEGAQAIADSGHLASLTSLGLSCSSIGDAGAQAIAGSSNMRSLRSLDLCVNRIGAEGAQAIAGSSTMRSLTSLDLCLNRIGAVGAQAIRQQYPNCRVVTSRFF